MRTQEGDVLDVTGTGFVGAACSAITLTGGPSSSTTLTGSPTVADTAAITGCLIPDGLTAGDYDVGALTLGITSENTEGLEIMPFISDVVPQVDSGFYHFDLVGTNLFTATCGDVTFDGVSASDISDSPAGTVDANGHELATCAVPIGAPFI